MTTENRVNDKDAEEVYELADCIAGAERGDAIDQVLLGLCYKEGEHVPQSYDLALKWFHAAAAQGNLEAMGELFECYSLGNGVKRSLSDAIFWAEKMACTSDDPKFAVEAALLHIMGDRYLDLIEQFKTESLSQSVFCEPTIDAGLAYASGGIPSRFAESFEAIGLPNEKVALAPFAIGMLAFTSSYIYSKMTATDHVTQLLIEEYADRISYYVRLAGTVEYIDPAETIRNGQKWFALAEAKGAPIGDGVPRLLDSPIALDQRDCDGEPVWSRTLPSRIKRDDDLLNAIFTAIVNRLSDDARNGSANARKVLAVQYYLRESQVDHPQSMDEALQALYFPNSDNDLDTLVEVLNDLVTQPNRPKQELVRHDILYRLLMRRYVQQFDGPLLQRIQSYMNERSSKGFKRLLERCDEICAATAEDEIAEARKEVFSLAASCTGSSLPLDLVLNDCDLRPGLANSILAFVNETQSGRNALSALMVGLICPELERLEVSAEKSEFDVKEMRYNPTASTLATVLLACLDSDLTKRAKRLTTCYELKDITAAYLLSRDEREPHSERERLLQCVGDALNHLNKQCLRNDWAVFGVGEPPLPDYMMALYAGVERQAHNDMRLQIQEQLLRNEREKREAEENMMAMFAHKFRGPVDSILFNTANLHDERIYIDAARTMNGLLDVFSVVSTTPEKLASSLKDDGGGVGSPDSVLLHAMKLALVQLTSSRNRLRMSPHYLAYAKRQGQVPDDLRQSEWMRDSQWVSKEVELQTQWEQEVGKMMLGTDIEVVKKWMATHLLPVHIEGFSEGSERFAEYGAKASLLTVVFTEVLVNAIKHATPAAVEPLIISWANEQTSSGTIEFVCTNPSTLESRRREKSKGSGRGHKFLTLIANHLSGSFLAEVTRDDSRISLTMPSELFVGGAV